MFGVEYRREIRCPRERVFEVTRDESLQCVLSPRGRLVSKENKNEENMKDEH